MRLKSAEDLRTRIQNMVGDSWTNYSILVVDFQSGFSMGINEAAVYDAASVNKIPILATLYLLVDQGEIDLDGSISIQTKDLQDYGTGTIRYDPPGSAYTIRTLARLMMQKSDNTAAYVLSNRVIGLKNIQAKVNEWGLTQTDMNENTTSNKDMAILVRKIAEGEIASPALTKDLLSFLTDSDFEERIPALLPESATVYHKIGNQVGIIHDVGFVSEGNMRYYIGFFTSNLKNEKAAEELEARVSKLVYDFLRVP
jgi:beta-lactamase class A